jgi:hypothetical protein
MFVKVINMNSPGDFVIYPFDRHIQVNLMRIMDNDTPAEELGAREHRVTSSMIERQARLGILDEAPFGLEDTKPGRTALIVEIIQQDELSVNFDGFVHNEVRKIYLHLLFQNVVGYILNNEGKTVDKFKHHLERKIEHRIATKMKHRV